MADLTFTDDIILDTRPPAVASASVTSPPGVAATAGRTPIWTVKVKATDDNSGVGFVQVTSNKRSRARCSLRSRS